LSEIIETANKIDPLLSNTTRLLILASLYIIGSMYEADLAKFLKTSWEKLATHFNKLEKAGYIKKQKVIGEDRPRTLIKPTKQGITKLHQHLEALTQLHTKLKKTALNPKQ